MFERVAEKTEGELRARERKDGKQKDCAQLRKSFLLVPLPVAIDVHAHDGC
jgi:hypothetical protein